MAITKLVRVPAPGPGGRKYGEMVTMESGQRGGNRGTTRQREDQIINPPFALF
jgi:hypothetical protein